MPVGWALRNAKLRYLQGLPTGGLSPYDAKSMMEAVLYGLPMYAVHVPNTAHPMDYVPPIDITQIATVPLSIDLVAQQLELYPDLQLQTGSNRRLLQHRRGNAVLVARQSRTSPAARCVHPHFDRNWPFVGTTRRNPQIRNPDPHRRRRSGHHAPGDRHRARRTGAPAGLGMVVTADILGQQPGRQHPQSGRHLRALQRAHQRNAFASASRNRCSVHAPVEPRLRPAPHPFGTGVTNFPTAAVSN